MNIFKWLQTKEILYVKRPLWVELYHTGFIRKMEYIDYDLEPIQFDKTGKTIDLINFVSSLKETLYNDLEYLYFPIEVMDFFINRKLNYSLTCIRDSQSINQLEEELTKVDINILSVLKYHQVCGFAEEDNWLRRHISSKYYPNLSKELTNDIDGYRKLRLLIAYTVCKEVNHIFGVFKVGKYSY